jgi:hypothetical protein
MMACNSEQTANRPVDIEKAYRQPVGFCSAYSRTGVIEANHFGVFSGSLNSPFSRSVALDGAKLSRSP